jgi:hypothetical protein
MVTKVYGDTGVDKIVDGAVTSSDFAAGVGGKILQVVTAQKTDTFSTNSTSFVDVTGLSVSITPSSASSKILILASLSLGNDGTHCSARIYRDAVSIAKGDSAGSRIRATWHASPPSTADINSKNMSWVDEPATTSATTYKISISVPNSSSYNVYVNRAANDTDAQYQSRVASSITVMEISA